jgi:quinol monooxygenase YgiN
MIVFIAKLNVAEGREADFERLQTELSQISHEKEPGLVVYDVIRHAENRGEYVVYARFMNKEAFEFHQEADFHHRLVPPILDCVVGEMDLQFYELVES